LKHSEIISLRVLLEIVSKNCFAKDINRPEYALLTLKCSILL